MIRTKFLTAIAATLAAAAVPVSAGAGLRSATIEHHIARGARVFRLEAQLSAPCVLAFLDADGRPFTAWNDYTGGAWTCAMSRGVYGITLQPKGPLRKTDFIRTMVNGDEITRLAREECARLGVPFPLPFRYDWTS
ncbi:MAG: hypothetical protein JWM87_782 [Candidatus Eremiobacteraeota bacterium]|nr:hypothetical protein [Candidatus Eremiobacteraeota bacterium]